MTCDTQYSRTHCSNAHSSRTMVCKQIGLRGPIANGISSYNVELRLICKLIDRVHRPYKEKQYEKQRDRATDFVKVLEPGLL
jgi:hypothetical protein